MAQKIKIEEILVSFGHSPSASAKFPLNAYIVLALHIAETVKHIRHLLSVPLDSSVLFRRFLTRGFGNPCLSGGRAEQKHFRR